MGPFTRESATRREPTLSVRDARLEAIERRYFARLLGHRPTRADAPLVPGMNLSDL